jgi:hypothetical protein
MADSNKSAVELLKELRKERDELNVLIQGLEKRLGIATSQETSGLDVQEEELRAAGIPTVTSMPIGFFHNLSQAAAAEKLLKMNPGQALTTAQILESFKHSGMKINPKNAITILYTALSRSPRFERVGNKAWGLGEWYPERKRKLSREQETVSTKDSSES